MPIKALIDDYDNMSSFLSNNLQDYDKPIYVVSGYQGESLDKIRQNIKGKGMLRVGAPNTSGDLDVKTYQIPYEARKEKMAMDKEAIYKFGMAFDSSQSGDGNITNIVIKSRYSLLDLKCNKIEPRLRAMLKWCLELILQDIHRKGEGNYSLDDVEINIERNMLFNENDTATKELTEAQTKQTLIAALVSAAPYLTDDEITKQICEYFELDYEEVLAQLETEDEEVLEREDDVPEDDEVAEGNP